MTASSTLSQGAIALRRRVQAQGAVAARSSIDRAAGFRAIEISLSSALRLRARRAGAPKALLRRAEDPNLGLLRSRLAVYRLLRQVSAGDLTRLPLLFEKIGNQMTDEERWAVYRLAGFPVDRVSTHSDSQSISTELGDSISAEIDETGDSTLLEWLIGKQRFDLADPGFQHLIARRCERALNARLVTERLEAQRLVPDSYSMRQWAALKALAALDTDRDIDIFLGGSTLLGVHQEADLLPERVLEFGTTADLSVIEAQLADRGAVVLQRSERRLRVEHTASRVVADVYRYYKEEGRLAHGNSAYTRWHRNFALAVVATPAAQFRAPDDIERYLDERFGDWRTPTLFFDRVFNSPNTTPDITLDSLVYLYRRAKHAFATGSRYYADAASERMRDTFGIDYSMHVPQPVHPKVLSTPFSSINSAGSDIIVVASGFHRLSGREIELLARASDNGNVVVAAVHDDGKPDLHDRLARVKTLRAVSHGAVFDSTEELAALCAEVGAIAVRADADLPETLTAGLTTEVTGLEPTSGPTA